MLAVTALRVELRVELRPEPLLFNYKVANPPRLRERVARVAFEVKPSAHHVDVTVVHVERAGEAVARLRVVL